MKGIMIVVSLLLIVWAAPLAQSCSCIGGSFQVPMAEAIRSDYCSSYSSGNVYAAMVIGATCNCIPDPREDFSPSSRLDCQQYALVDQTNINASILVQGECAFERFSAYPFNQGGCPMLESSIAGSGLSVMRQPPPSARVNLTNAENCRYSCPFNQRTNTIQYYYTQQPCLYTVRISETFKGNYSVGDEIEVIGPDVVTSCGQLGRVLEVGTVYVAGIGGPCNPIPEWTESSDYRPQDLELLRRLRDEGCPATATATTPTAATTTPTIAVTSAAVAVLHISTATTTLLLLCCLATTFKAF